MENLRNLIGGRIRVIRKMKGLTQDKLAERSNLDDSYLGAIERGERNVSIDTIDKIIDALEVPYNELFQFEKELSEEQMARRRAVDEYIGMVSNLSVKELEILKRINKEVYHAFNVKVE